MDKAAHRKIASMGGRALRPEQRSFSQDRELAAVAGRKGGLAVPKERRSFAQDRELAARAGHKGGVAIPPEQRSFSQDPELAAAAGRAGARSRALQAAQDRQLLDGLKPGRGKTIFAGSKFCAVCKRGLIAFKPGDTCLCGARGVAKPDKAAAVEF
jgi:general stress protein YciG